MRGDYIVTLYFHSWQYLVRGWLYRDMIFSPLTIFSQGVIISWPHIFTPDNISWGGDYIITWYSHPWQYLVRGWLYHDIIFLLLAIFCEGVIILWHYIFAPGNVWWGGDYIFTPDNIWCGGDYIVTLYFHSWQYLVRGWIYRDIIFSLLTIFREGVIISWHYNIISDTTLESGTGGDYIWMFSLSKYDSAVIPGFYYSYPYIHPMKLGGVEVIIFKHDTLFAVET